MQLPVKSNKRLAFFFNYNDMKRLETRWVHVIGRDDLTLLRLAVKYKLHPMAVLDSMQLRAKPPTCVLYGRDFFISCPQIRLTKEALRRLQQHRQKQSAAAIELESAGYDSELNVEYDLTLSAPPVHVECEQAPTGLFYMREMEVLITMEQTWIKLVRKKHEGRDRSKSASRQCRRCWCQWIGHCKVHCCGGRASTLKRHTASANRVATEQPDQSTSEELRSTSVTPSHSRRLLPVP